MYLYNQHICLETNNVPIFPQAPNENREFPNE